MYMTVPRTILFREEHSPRVLVERVAHVSAPGTSPPGVFRRGTAQALVTGRCVFRFDPARARFSLESLHPGETLEGVRAATGFDVRRGGRGRAGDAGADGRGIGAAARAGLRRDAADLPGILRARVRKEGCRMNGRAAPKRRERAGAVARRAGRAEGDRPDARAGRAVLHHGAVRPRRRGGQAGAAPGRRGARLGAALRRGGRRLLLPRREPQQALGRARPVEAGGAGGAAAPPGGRRRAGGEFQAGLAWRSGASATRGCCGSASRG